MVAHPRRPRTPLARTPLPWAIAALCIALLPGCSPEEGCLGGDDGACVPPSACRALAFSCGAPALDLHTITRADERPPGLNALASVGDVVLSNGLVTAVIDAIEAPHYLAPSGGSLVDLVVTDGATGDDMNQMLQVAGILPEDAARYRSLELLDERPTLVAVIARGVLDGRPGVDVVTRYELRPCEPGLRVRTELYHGGRDLYAFFLADAFFWGDREVTPFVPLPGQGFTHPEIELETIGESFRSPPFVVAQAHTPGGGAYALVPCQRAGFEGFQSDTISGVGAARRLLEPGDGLAYERFIGAATGPGLAPALALAWTARAQLFGDRHVTLRGRAVGPDGRPLGGDERLATLLVHEPAATGSPDDPETRRPWAEVVPDADGRFAVAVPAGRPLRLLRHAFGRELPDPVPVPASVIDLDVGDIAFPADGLVEARVVAHSGAGLLAELVLSPTGPTRREDVTGSHYGFFAIDDCAPWLGPPHGASPACNRVLTERDGRATFAAPPGTYHVYATHGPTWTLARETLTVTASTTTSVTLSLSPLPDLLPPGVLSADLHVHAGASFDSAFPERDRARTFVATGVDVIAATDHDVVTTYARAIAELELGDRVVVMPGVETTGQILFYRPPGSEFPAVIGHFNFWPLRHDSSAPRNGAPDDEHLEPAELFDAITPLLAGEGVFQLNHPYAEAKLGRDEGFAAAIGYDPRDPIPDAATDTPAGVWRRRPGGPGAHSNLDFHAQDVMNGATTWQFIKYRTFWHSLLDQGHLRTGTANSDSHTLGIEVLGYPRNYVFADQTLATFDRDAFNRAIKAGRIVGSNGPLVLVSVPGDDGRTHGPGLEPFRPARGAALEIEVRAAPWIPVQEVRIIVGGEVVETIGGDGLVHPADPFGTEDLVRFRGTRPLADLLAAANVDADTWLVVEAGHPLVVAADLDDDGVPDTTDNDGDGVIDEADHEDREEDEYFAEPPRPTEDDPRYHLAVIAPGTWPTAFTNPLVLDLDGDGWVPPGLGPRGGR